MSNGGKSELEKQYANILTRALELQEENKQYRKALGKKQEEIVKYREILANHVDYDIWCEEGEAVE